MEREEHFTRLYPLQDAVLAAFAATDTEFYLTGGTAASRAYLGHRFSDDSASSSTTIRSSVSGRTGSSRRRPARRAGR